MGAASQVIFSPLCGKAECQGTSVDILIYVNDFSWELAVVDEDGNSTVWDVSFESDRDAMNEAIRTLVKEGLKIFTNPPVETIH